MNNLRIFYGNDSAIYNEGDAVRSLHAPVFVGTVADKKLAVPP